jgi:hypothetical protein
MTRNLHNKLDARPPLHVGIIFMCKPNVAVSSRQHSEPPATVRVKARRVTFLVWSPGVRVESRRPKVAP